MITMINVAVCVYKYIDECVHEIHRVFLSAVPFSHLKQNQLLKRHHKRSFQRNDGLYGTDHNCQRKRNTREVILEFLRTKWTIRNNHSSHGSIWECNKVGTRDVLRTNPPPSPQNAWGFPKIEDEKPVENFSLLFFEMPYQVGSQLQCFSGLVVLYIHSAQVFVGISYIDIFGLVLCFLV